MAPDISYTNDPVYKHPNFTSQQVLNILFADPNISSIANYERLCKLEDQTYAICPDYCCGEFWESSPRFCCQVNFKPIRNLFFYLLTAFASLFTTIILWLIVEGIVKVRIMAAISILEVLNPVSNLKDLQTIDRDNVSSVDDDSSSFSENVGRKAKARDILMLSKHSQSFKNMSKVNTIRRQKSVKSLDDIRRKSSKSAKSFALRSNESSLNLSGSD